MAETLEVQLTRVQAAIAAIESGAQEYTYRDKQLVRAKLETLYRREKDLLSRIDAAAAGGTTAYAGRPE